LEVFAMALAKVVAGKKLLIKVSDGGGTPVYAHPCLINAARGIAFTAETNDTRIPDCDDPELIAWIKREKVSMSGSINGAGVLNTTDTEFYFNWVKSADPIAVRVELNGVVAANGGGYFSGDWHCTQFELTGDLGDYVQCTIGLVSDGDITWTDAAA
jgi:hypothetical protein